jgi:thioester reductase-like protein
VAIFVTGSTGYIGAHIVANLLDECGEPLDLLVRAKNPQEARERLWQSLQLHMDFPRFREFAESRARIFLGDLTGKNFGIEPDDYKELVRTTDSVIHCAASLNRKSEKSCLNVNLRGTLQVIELGMRARDSHGLRRFSHVSTVAVAGQRQSEVVCEDSAIDWERSDYDPYARTKKFCEHMIGELLPDVQQTIFRPSIVLGDSRRPETNQFDMVKAFVFLAGLPVLPFRATDKVDIVPVDYVAGAISRLHLKEKPEHEIYHLSSGTDSETYKELTAALAAAQEKRAPTFAPSLEKSTAGMVNFLSRRAGKAGKLATLLKVFLPYLTWNTVFDNARVVKEMGAKPAPFSKYCFPLLKFSRDNHFAYPYKPWLRESDSGMEQSAVRGASRGTSR